MDRLCLAIHGLSLTEVLVANPPIQDDEEGNASHDQR
jgi:hypothetical protein